MKRREVLIGSGAALLSSLSGCSAINSFTSQSHQIGEAVEHNGIQVNPNGYVLSSEVGFDIADANNILNRNAPEGATYILTHLNVKHVGENERTFPGRGMSQPGSINLAYKGEELDIPQFSDVSKSFIVSGNAFPTYGQVLFDKNLISGVYSGEASGWISNEIPKGFDPTETVLKVKWGSSSLVGEDENDKTVSWEYSKDMEYTPKEAKEEFGGPKTISM